jgi:hypothetical protein
VHAPVLLVLPMVLSPLPKRADAVVAGRTQALERLGNDHLRDQGGRKRK